MQREQIIEEIGKRLGEADEAAIVSALQATLSAVGERLLDIDSAVVASRLPDSVAGWLTPHAARDDAREMTLDGLYHEVSAHTGVPLGAAVERAQAVGQALSTLLDNDARQHLLLHLPPEFAELFTPRPPVAEARGAAHARQTAPGGGHTLADGRTGSHRPMSEAGLVHSGSVVASDNPHGDIKLSSAKGISTERDHDTLADGKPGSHHPVSEAD